MFDYRALHSHDKGTDMDDPVGAAAHIKKSLKRDGTFMVVEPLAANNLGDNLDLLASIFYGFSTTICVPTSKAQEVGLMQGAQAGENASPMFLKRVASGRFIEPQKPRQIWFWKQGPDKHKHA